MDGWPTLGNSWPKILGLGHPEEAIDWKFQQIKCFYNEFKEIEVCKVVSLLQEEAPCKGLFTQKNNNRNLKVGFTNSHSYIYIYIIYMIFISSTNLCHPLPQKSVFDRHQVSNSSLARGACQHFNLGCS